MLRLKRFFTAYFVFLVALVLTGCPDLPTPTGCVVYKSLQVTSLDNTGRNPVVLTSGSVPAKAFALQVNFIATSQICLHSSAFTVQAMKCTSGEPYYSKRDTLLSLNVFSTVDFDSLHKAGTPLNDLFVKKNGAVLRLASDSLFNDNATFYLFGNPEQTTAYRFIVNAHLSGGKVLSDTTPAINLTK